MSAADGKHPYDLEERTCIFAKRVRAFVRRIPRSICNTEDIKQLARASGSVGANYIEANEALGKATASGSFNRLSTVTARSHP